MDKPKRWQLILIVAVILLTVYNILPTVSFYSQPLSSPITQKEGMVIAQEALERVDALKEQSTAWLSSYAKNLRLHPKSINIDSEDQQLVEVTLASKEEADTFRRYLNEAGARIPFVPAILMQAPTQSEEDPATVLVRRNIAVSIPSSQAEDFFQLVTKQTENQQVSQQYAAIIYDRFEEVSLALGGTSPASELLRFSLQTGNKQQQADAAALQIAKNVLDYVNLLGLEHPLTKRYFASFTQGNWPNKKEPLQKLISRLGVIKKDLQEQDKQIVASLEQAQQGENSFVDPRLIQEQQMLGSQLRVLDEALAIFNKNASLFTGGLSPLSKEEVMAAVQPNEQHALGTKVELSLEGRNPFVSKVAIDWINEEFELQLYNDLEEVEQSYLKDRVQQLVIGEMARVAQASHESILPGQQGYAIALNSLTNSSSLLVLDLKALATQKVEHVAQYLQREWHPQHKDLQPEVFPIWNEEQYLTLSPAEQKLGLLVAAPALEQQEMVSSFRNNSIYVIAKGLHSILQKYEATPNNDEARLFFQDIEQLSDLLAQDGYISYPAAAYDFPQGYAQDYIFEQPDYFNTFLAATRENFSVHGSMHYATLELTNWQQRITAKNALLDQQHEELLQWRDDYHTAQVSLNPLDAKLVPPPTKSALWDNIKLSTYKYFHGDESRVLRWGLDLAGGKSVRIALKDQDNQIVRENIDLTEGANELYTRVNKMGLSEVDIRVQGDNIVLNFPGSQALSASELVTASSMKFHIVNEKFAPKSPSLGQVVNGFLQDVWHEAVITNQKTMEGVNKIAWEHLGSNNDEDYSGAPISENARILLENGFRLADPVTSHSTSNFDNALVKIALFRGDDASQWYGQSHPLLVVFNNYVLDGTSLTNVHTEYNPNRGNVLVFGVASSSKKGTTNPQDDYYTWTANYAQETILGTPKEVYTQGNGWRMAVVLNDQVVSAASLRNPLRNHSEISGNFSQREAMQLASDLKAGSLTFTPHIIAERNISPELGQAERNLSINAAIFGLLLVVAAMIWYYRFGGVIASLAVLFNLLIIWGVLQNLDAALTLPSIAGIILTIGMAVDANVLVFERIREEFAVTKRLASAIHAGYKKAFSAIIDSNLTTIIAAFILIQFDSGPIKGFAMTLIIGIASSMFTALFMTRFFFAHWIRRTSAKTLKMLNLVSAPTVNFLSKARAASVMALLIIAVGGYFVVSERNTLFGMDFTGGYALNLEFATPANEKIVKRVTTALTDAGAQSHDFMVRELNRPNMLSIQFGMSMNEPGHPFHSIDSEQPAAASLIPTDNVRLAWSINALQTSGLPITQDSLDHLDNSWTTMSGQFSDTMRNNALIALGCALLCILLYITIRFEWVYALGAIVCTAHDILVSVALIGILYKVGIPLQIDLQVIGAIMTIIGYSLNDTIIIFDRIREDARLHKKLDFSDIINQSISKTLSRTVITSMTTALVLLALVGLGGSMIFDFSLVMLIGVIVGTLSSMFIAPAALKYFFLQAEKKKQDNTRSMRLKNA